MNGRDQLRSSIRTGIVAGIVLVYLALIGMIEAFDTRILIGDTVTLGKTLLAFPVFLAAYVLVRPRLRGGVYLQPKPSAAVWMGAVAGGLAGGIVIAAVALTLPFGALTTREIFVQVSPTLLSLLEFGRSVPVAAVVLIMGGAALGALGAGFRSLPVRVRRPLTIALGVTFGLALFQTIVPQVLVNLHLTTTWLYSDISGGLNVPGAFVAFIVAGVLAGVWTVRGGAVHDRFRRLPGGERKGVAAAGWLVVLGLLAVLPALVGENLSQVLGTVGLYVLLGLGLNIVVGYAGLLDLGYVAFFAVGAYAMALLTGAHVVTSLGAVANPTFSLHLDFYAAIPLVVLVAAAVGLLIGAPVLRLRGDYLAIVTLGFGEIARVLVQSDWLQHLLGGAQGLRDVTDAAIAGLSFRNPRPFYYLVLAFCLLTIYVSWRLSSSRIGRAWNAMREDEQVAEAMGVSTVRYKLLAFATGAGLGSFSGALFAVKIGSLAPTSFTILVSITVLAVIILGGMGSIPGVILGALVLIGLPGFLTEFDEYQLLLYGAALILIMLLRPQGLIPNVRRMRELKEEEAGQDAWARRTGDASAAASVGVGTAPGATGAVE
jgi:branched-chain amino acid transport system permease protein